MILQSSPPDPDQELVTRARKGDSGAFDCLVAQHHERIYGLVFHMTSQREDANDLVQEIWVRVHNSLHLFRGDSKFHTWIHQIAVNHTLNFIKRRKSRAGRIVQLPEWDEDHHAGMEDPCRSANPEKCVSLRELRDLLQDAIGRLSPAHRAVVRMFDIQGMAHREIAQALQTSEGTVRSRLHYAHQQLQASLYETRELWS